MDGHIAILMDMRRRGSSRQNRPGGEEHHGHESHDLPDKSLPYVSPLFRRSASSGCVEFQVFARSNTDAP
jgi:hypothetical protein